MKTDFFPYPYDVFTTNCHRHHIEETVEIIIIIIKHMNTNRSFFPSNFLSFAFNFRFFVLTFYLFSYFLRYRYIIIIIISVVASITFWMSILPQKKLYRNLVLYVCSLSVSITILLNLYIEFFKIYHYYFIFQVIINLFIYFLQYCSNSNSFKCSLINLFCIILCSILNFLYIFFQISYNIW